MLAPLMREAASHGLLLTVHVSWHAGQTGQPATHWAAVMAYACVATAWWRPQGTLTPEAVQVHSALRTGAIRHR